jgi:hypothetical protein
MKEMGRQFCEAASVCSTLRHDWLEHQIIRPLRAEKAMWMGAEGVPSLPVFFRGLAEWISEAKTFADEAVEGFSPSRLVDPGLLGQLSEEVRSLVKDGVHQAYLDRRVMQPLVEELRKAIASFEVAADELAKAWSGDPGERGRAIEQFEPSAVCLLGTLGRFPLGVLLC